MQAPGTSLVLHQLGRAHYGTTLRYGPWVGIPARRDQDISTGDALPDESSRQSQSAPDQPTAGEYEARFADRLEYRHQHAYDELLLALPDIVPWSWVRSGEWRRRISPILTTVRTV